MIGVQVLRAIAAIGVCVHHAMEESRYVEYAYAPPDWLVLLGAAGVDIFFVISGFIMVLIALPPGRAPDRPLRFMRRRIERIYPFYWYCCLAVLALKTVGFYAELPVDGGIVVRSLLLLPADHRLVGVAWTLVFEMYFYAVFALSLASGSRGSALALAITGIAALYFVASVLPDGPTSGVIGDSIVFEFVLGMLLAWMAGNGGLRPLFRRAWIPGAFLLVLASLWLPADSTAGLDAPGRVLGWGLGALLIVTSAVMSQPKPGQLTRLLALLGDASYAIYLTHGFVLIIYAAALRRVAALASISQWLVLPLVVVACIAGGLAAHLMAEKPLLRCARLITGRMIPGGARS